MSDSSIKITVEMKPIQQVINELGINPKGEVQKFVTAVIDQRLTAYMPYRTGWLATKAKYIKSPTEIEVVGPQVNVMYFGIKMVNAATGSGPALIPGVGFRYRRGTILKESGQKLNYSTIHNPRAGPYWEKHMMAAEGEKIAAMVRRRYGGRG